jgi:hypothetical protein
VRHTVTGRGESVIVFLSLLASTPDEWWEVEPSKKMTRI